MVLIIIFSELLNRKYCPLNALGGALFTSIILDPYVIFNIGFQLSYLSCFAIFIIFPVIEKFSEKIFEKKSLKKMNLFNRASYMLLTFFKSSLLLTFSITIILFPIIIYHFEKFPIFSFFYNLFIPIMIIVIIFLMFSSILLYFIYIPFGDILFRLNTQISKNLLLIIYHPPAEINYVFRFKGLNLEILVTYIFLVSMIFIYINNFLKEKEMKILKFF